MGHADDITEYDHALPEGLRAIAATLQSHIEAALPSAAGKVWHGHPVWFLDENPIVGYSESRDGIQLLFWSGQSFPTADLSPVGKFQAAEARYSAGSDVDTAALGAWLAESSAIQWDYQNLPKNRELVKLTAF